MLLGVDGCKLHNMVANRKDSEESCGSHDSSYAVKFFFLFPPPDYAVWLNPSLFGSFV